MFSNHDSTHISTLWDLQFVVQSLHLDSRPWGINVEALDPEIFLPIPLSGIEISEPRSGMCSTTVYIYALLDRTVYLSQCFIWVTHIIIIVLLLLVLGSRTVLVCTCVIKHLPTWSYYTLLIWIRNLASQKSSVSVKCGIFQVGTSFFSF